MFSQQYTFSSVSLGQQGTEFTLKAFSSVYSFLLCGLLCGTCAMIGWKVKNNANIGVSAYSAVGLLCFLALIILFFINNSTYNESLLILSSVGVTLKSGSWLSTTSRYYDIHQINDIVIIEAIKMHSVIFQLVLLSKGDPKSSKTVHPLFQHFRPKLHELKLIYHDVQEKLILPCRASTDNSPLT